MNPDSFRSDESVEARRERTRAPPGAYARALVSYDAKNNPNRFLPAHKAT